MAAGGGIDFNDTPSADRSPLYDLDELKQRLADTAAEWVPRLFPNGRRQEDEWRLADISGRAPRNTGSCVIALGGDKAGSYYDFADGSSGSPMMTVENACGLSGRALFDFAAEICGYAKPTGREVVPHSIGADRDLPGDAVRSSADKKQPAAETEIANILAHSFPAAGTLVEAYFTSRKLKLPENCSDLLFNPSITDWKTKVGWPAMIAVVRNAAGEPTGGIHRTYLARDGTGKADLPKAKKMLAVDKGAFKGAAVRLAPIGADGHLGLAEGIETACAAAELHGVPVWAALSAGALADFEIPAEVRKLTIFADAGEAGMKAARALAERAGSVAIEIRLPASDDDFAKDLAQQPQILPPEDAALKLIQNISNLSQDSSTDDIFAVLKVLAEVRPDSLAVAQNLKTIGARTGQRPGALKAAYAEARKQVAPAPRQMTASGPAPAWISRMIATEAGEPKALLENAAVALQEDAAWREVLWWDEFRHRVMARRPPPWSNLNGSFVERPWSDQDDLLTTRWLQRCGLHVPTLLVHDAVVNVAGESPYHPVREYLDSLKWDGLRRLESWAADYLGAAGDAAYISGVTAKFLISAVARILSPGCKVDHMLILEGPQNLGKSTAVRVLFHPWVSEEIAELGSKDAAQQLVGKWCFEFAELDAMKRAEQSRLKAFITRTEDHYRPPYGRHPVDQPRQCVFVGTVNEDSYLDDPTGGRRFWPIKCTKIDASGLFEARGMLWAEAVSRYRLGEPYHLVEPELIAVAREQQEERQQTDAWDDLISRHLEGGSAFPFAETTISEIMSAIGIPKDRWNKPDQIRVGRWLKKNSWVRFKKDIGRDNTGRRQFEWRYRRPAS